MDYKALAQQTAQEILGYYQDTSGWKVVKNSVRKQVIYISIVCFFNGKQIIAKTFFFNIFFYELKKFLLSFFCLFFKFISFCI